MRNPTQLIQTGAQPAAGCRRTDCRWSGSCRRRSSPSPPTRSAVSRAPSSPHHTKERPPMRTYRRHAVDVTAVLAALSVSLGGPAAALAIPADARRASTSSSRAERREGGRHAGRVRQTRAVVVADRHQGRRHAAGLPGREPRAGVQPPDHDRGRAAGAHDRARHRPRAPDHPRRPRAARGARHRRRRRRTTAVTRT